MYLDLFPKFKVVEINNSAAQRSGHILAQFPARAEAVVNKVINTYDEAGEPATVKVLENGAIVCLNEKAELVNCTTETLGQPGLVMNDEITTNGLEGLDQYCEVFENDVTYPRVLPLYVGDSFTTNNFSGEVSTAKAAKVVAGVITLQTNADKDSIFVAKASTLPAGQKAVALTYVGKTIAAA